MTAPPADATVIPLHPPGGGPPPGGQPPPGTGADSGEPKRQPIIPGHLHRANLPATIREAAGLHFHRFRYHGIRAPVYLVITAAYAARGATRLTGRLLRWCDWSEGRALESLAIAAGRAGHHDAMRAHVEGKRTRAARWQVTIACAVLAAVPAVVLVAVLPWWGWVPLGTGLGLALARHGKPEGKRIVSAAVVPQRFTAPTFELISQALGSVLPPVKNALKNGPLDFVIDVHPDGPGWSCQLNLPPGVTATQVMNKRAELSSAGRWPLSATWPAGVPDHHEGRLELWIGQQDMSKAPPLRHPLVKGGTANVFDLVPFGETPRGVPVCVPLVEMNWLFGAAPGQGKTASVRSLLAPAAMDPVCDLWIHEHSGKGDLEPFRIISHRYVSGTDDDSVAYAAESLMMLRAEYGSRIKRYNRLRDLGQAPDYKVTREMAADPRNRLRPIVAVFDEAQNVFMHPDFKDQAIDDSGYVIRVSRALAMILILSTQRPSADCVPTAVTGNILCRFCLCVPGQPENDMVLGTSARSRGYDATQFRPGTDRGQGWLKTGEGAPQVVRTYYLNDSDTKKLAARSRAMREKAGVLSGVALDESPEDAERDVLADVLAAFGTDTGLHWPVLAERLAVRFPDRWAGATGDAVSAQCRSLGVPTVQVKMGGRNLQGCRRADAENPVVK